MSGFRFLRRSMENDGVGAPAEMVSETAVELSDGITTAVEEEAAIAEVVNNIEEGAEAAETFEGVADQFQASLDPETSGTGQEEGVSAETVAVAQESLSRLLRKIGVPKTSVFPSLESFSKNSRSARVTATRYAIEGFVDTVKNIWKAIVDMFKNMWTKIKDFFASFFANAEKLEKRAIELKKTIYERTNGKKSPSEKVKNKGIANKLQDGEGKCSPSIAIARLKALQKLGTLPSAIGSSIANLLSSDSDNLISFMKKKASANNAGGQGATSTTVDADVAVKENLEKIEAAVGRVTGEIFTQMDATPSDATAKKIKSELEKEFKDYETAGDKHVNASGPFVDGKYLICKVFKKKRGGDNDGKQDYITSMSFKLSFENPFDKDADESMDALTSGDMETICDLVKAVAVQAQAIKKELKNTDSTMSNGIKVAESAIAVAETANAESDQGVKVCISVLKGIVTSAGSTAATISTNLPTTLVFGGAKALDYVSESMKLYK